MNYAESVFTVICGLRAMPLPEAAMELHKIILGVRRSERRRLGMFDLIIRGSIHEMTGDQKDYLLGKGLITLNEADQTYTLADTMFTAADVTYLLSLSDDQ